MSEIFSKVHLKGKSKSDKNYYSKNIFSVNFTPHRLIVGNVGILKILA